MPLRHYQVEGVDFLRCRENAILADEPGLGKSAQAIIAAEHPDLRNILIICPAIGRVSWPIELKKWDIAERKIVHVGNGATLPIGVEGQPGGVFIVTYDLLSRGGLAAQNLVTSVKSGFFDLMVIDEGQYLKDTASKRTKLVYGILSRYIGNIWVLSGTITPNSNAELYPHIKALFPGLLHKLFPQLNGRTATRQEFEDQFCHIRSTPFGNGRQITGNRNTAVLRDALKPVLLRRRATEVKDELPALTIEDLSFTEDDIAGLLAPSQIAALVAAGAAFDKAYRELEAQDIVPLGIPSHIASERRALGLAKVPLAAAWAEDLLTNGQDKVILFAHHQDVIASLTAALLDYAPVAITGETLLADRVHRIHQFQTLPHVRVLVGNMQAAGTSVTLTASNRVGIVEPSWVPGDNEQAIRRSYRIGQTRAVTATYLSVAKSLDSQITKTLIRKAGDIAALLDHEEKTNADQT